jgi:CBS domain containing-hemolysin-like protein
MPEPGTTLIAGAVGIAALGSFFAAADAALHALPEARLVAVSTTDPSSSTPFLRYANDRERIHSRWLVCRVLATTLAAVLFDQAAESYGLHRGASAVGVGGAVLVYGTFAEVLQTLARKVPDRVALLALRLLRPFEWAVMPIAEPLALLGRIVARLAPERPVDARVTETEVAWMVQEGEKSGALGGEPAEMIRNVLEFKDVTAKAVMIPRRRISGIEIGAPLAKVVEIVGADGHSRYPVFRESLDNVIGMLYAKDLFRAMQREEKPQLAELVRSNIMFVAESQSIASILREMRARRQHMAIVTDEFGGTSGLVTLEDILEEIVGDIRDEYDVEAEQPIQDLGGGRVVADASVSLADLSAHLNRDIPAEGDYESVGGLVLHRVGRVPPVGETLQVDGLRFIVREADETRVVKVEIEPVVTS